MDFLLKSLRFLKISVILGVIQFDICYCLDLDKGPIVYKTKYGNLTGMIFQVGRQTPVDIFSGLQYASTRGRKLRFIPPIGSLEKWLGIRVFSDISHRGVCPQFVNNSHDVMILDKHLKQIVHFVGNQAEDCLMLSLYVPRKGNVLLH